MVDHKFEVGRIVRTRPRQDSAIPPGNYEVVRLLPSGDAARDPQYRVKSVLDGHERVVRESDLD
jgi:hypothetical protein